MAKFGLHVLKLVLKLVLKFGDKKMRTLQHEEVCWVTVAFIKISIVPGKSLPVESLANATDL